VYHSTSFEIEDKHFLAVAEHVENSGCGLNDHQLEFEPACNNYEVTSSIYEYDSRAVNANGDCTNVTEACTVFEGRFSFFQSIKTEGATYVHAFKTKVAGQSVHHFLAVAESHNNEYATAQSTIYKWNGRSFGVHQKLETFYAASIESFDEGDQTFLLVSNRGCPQTHRPVQGLNCDSFTLQGRTRLFSYNADTLRFQPVSESTIGSLHALGATTVNGETFLQGSSQWPVHATTIKLRTLPDSIALGPNITYVMVANNRVTESDTVGTCPDEDKSVCSRPASTFALSTTTLQVCTSLVQLPGNCYLV
jgi:hypothetical protein